MDAKLLLSQVNQIAEKYDEIYKSTGGYFNIFSIAHIDTDEVVICRVIKEFLKEVITKVQRIYSFLWSMF